ncbi:P2Y purinoceptor 8 [Myripristis murdjan]|uniref:P2Y purinoceptor 8 n=1 Tax=Myripristis murdjan TaxID=586833 RepID=UPI001175D178|nr:P2Y purinoceptor 8-like [Myripristis murdjan]XP_029936807.1 P2Y purinoceptor 8-like [Myripristis murdjan]
MMANSTIDNATLSMFQNETASITICIIYTIITTVNLAGNGISMWLLIFRTSPKTPSIIFMINLTLTDLILGAALPFQINYLVQGYNWNMGPSMCRFLTIVFFSNMYCSILTMTAISVDRYLGIIRPLRFRQMRESKFMAVIVCLLMWGLVLLVLHPLMTTDLTFYVPELQITTCFDMLRRDMLPSITAWAAFLFAMFVILFLFPFCITTFCYISVIRRLTRDSKTAQKGRAVRLAFTVLLVFTLCFAPNNILLITHTVQRLFYGRSLYLAYKLSLSFSCVNSCLDPFIYYFASKEFREKLRQMFKLRSLSSVDAPSFYSAHYTCNGQEGEHSKVCLSQSQ